MMKLKDILNEDANMNKKVKQLLDKNLKELTKGKPNHQFAVMHILMGALSDANFHSEAKQVAKLFPKAKYEGDPMAAKDVEEYYHYELGPDVANICKWDGKDIVDAIGFYVSMTIGRPVGEKVEKLVESVNEGKHDAMLDKLADIVKDAKSFMDIGSGLKKAGIKYSFGTNMIPMYIIDKPAKIAILNNKYADGAERVVGSTAIGLMEGMVAEVTYDLGMARKGNGLTIYNKAEEEAGDYKNIAHVDNKGKIKFYDKKLPSKIKKQIEDEAKKMIESMNENKSTKLKSLLNESFGIGELPSSKLIKMKVSFSEIMNEGRASAKKLLQSVVNGETSRVEGIKLSKEMAQSFLDWQRLSPYGKKYGDLPFHMLFKAAFNWGLHRHADKKSKEYKELEAKAKTMKK